MNKKSKPKRRCLLCGEKHKKEFCPIIGNKLSRYQQSKKRNFFMANVFLECAHKNVNFQVLLKEFEELTLEWRDFSDDEITIAYLDTSIEFFAAALDCSPSKFFKNAKDTTRELIELISKDFVPVEPKPFCWDQRGGIILTLKEPSEIHESRESWTFSPALYVKKCLSPNEPPIYRLYSSIVSPRRIHFQSMNTCLNSKVELVSEVDGELKNFFEEMYSKHWTDIALKVSFTDERFEVWANRLLSATNDYLLKWNELDDSTSFVSIYGEVSVKLCFNIGTAEMARLYIHAGNERGLVFLWKEYSDWDNQVFRIRQHSIDNLESSSDFPQEAEPTEPVLEDNPKNKGAVLKLRSLYDSIKNSNKTSYLDLISQNKVREKCIEYSDTVISASSLICNSRTHSILPYTGIIKLLSSDSTIINYKIYVGYCRDCNKYYIFDRDYENMLKEGTPLCNVYDRNKPISSNNVPFRYKSQSVLNAMGYTVGKHVDLNSKERQKILEEALQKNLFSIHDLLDFLNWLVSMHKSQIRYSDAIDKWNEDIEFVEEYRKNERKTVHISSVYR